MVETCPLHISAHIHLDLARLIRRTRVGYYLKGQHHDVRCNKAAQCVKRPCGNKLIQGIPLEERQYDIHQPACQSQKYHTDDDTAIRL